MTATVAEAIREAAAHLAATSDTARLDAELLMAHALGASRSDMLLRHAGDRAPDGFSSLVNRRSLHEPVAYIIGEQEFYGRSFAVRPGILIPRGDSETLIEAALEAVPQPTRVLDLGTGSGALLLTILAERPDASGVGVDVAPVAIEVARENAIALGLENHREFHRRDWREQGWMDGLGRFDLILCNPPYVEQDAPLDPDVRRFEPESALFAGADGLDDYKCLIPQIRELLRPAGVAVFEIGATQCDAVSALARDAGFALRVRHDLANRPRAVVLW